MTQMTLQDKAIGTALRMLDNLGCVYAVITPLGQTLGTLKVEPERKQKSPHKHGAIMNHARPFLTAIKIGDVGFIPFGEYEPKSFCSSISAYCSKQWGAKSYTYQTVEGGINLLRVL
jgi:hypothetical protein